MIRKSIALLAAVLMLLASSSAAAESAVDTVMNLGTTQAFTDEPVSDEDLDTILRAGLAAPSAINQQPWYFVAVRDQELMSEIAGSGAGFAPPAGAGNAPADAPKPGEGSFPAPPASQSAGSAKAGLGDSPAAIIIYRNDASKSPDPDFDCGLAAQNMAIAAASLGYGVKIISSPTRSLNGEKHDSLCEKMGVDPSMQAVAVLLIGHADDSVDAVSSASTRDSIESKASIIG